MAFLKDECENVFIITDQGPEIGFQPSLPATWRAFSELLLGGCDTNILLLRSCFTQIEGVDYFGYSSLVWDPGTTRAYTVQPIINDIIGLCCTAYAHDSSGCRTKNY